MSANIDRLVKVMERLRDPQTGCPWDIKQTMKTIAPYTVEEAYELLEAIENGDAHAMKDELGDVLFQVVFHAQMAREDSLFGLEEIAAHVADKMIERHPHVFGDRKADTAQDVLTNWEADKAAKRAAKAENEGRFDSVLDGVSTALPAMIRAVKLQKRAARVGFNSPGTHIAMDKIREEIDEFEAEIDAKADIDFLEAELGDVLFSIANIARKLHLDPEAALRRTNAKFERRFHGIEDALAKQGRNVASATLEEMDRIWNAIKAEEKAAMKRSAQA